jgi:capsular exopolysaccharide synthesis family protein
MSRIQQILDKAERDGVVQRTRSTVPAERDATDPPPILLPPGSRSDAAGSRRPSVRPPALDEAQERSAIRTATISPDLLVVAALAPQSPAAEQYRALRTRIAMAEDGRTLRTLLFTSPGRSDGKTLTSLNLALTMAQEFQRRVVLVDADLHRPTVHTLLGLASSPGLSDVLMGGATLDEALVDTLDYRLTVLPAGLPPTRPAELLGSSAMHTVLADLRSRFDRVIVDTPPAGILSDAGVLAPLMDGVVLVVRAGITPLPAIERVLENLDASRMLGVVLNDVGDPADGYGAKAYNGYHSPNEGRYPSARRIDGV